MKIATRCMFRGIFEIVLGYINKMEPIHSSNYNNSIDSYTSPFVETNILNEADWIKYYENELNMFLNLSLGLR